ncbi:aldose epimerase family protein, partial [Paraglaciecola aquimarina]
MIKSRHFGTLANGQEVTQYTLINKQGVSVDILTLGGILRRFQLPTSQGNKDIVLGFDTLEEYLTDGSYLGALVGRYANRIAQGKFSLNDQEFRVEVNQAGNCLHGGKVGFNAYPWNVEVLAENETPSLKLSILSWDGDQGFPGSIQVDVIYTLTENNTLRIEYFAKTDKDTVFNPTNHAYFNLNGHNSGSVKDHLISLVASSYTPTNENAIPTGEIASVKGTPFDLTELSPIKIALASSHPQIKYGNGLDHNMCLDNFSPIQTKANFAGTCVSDEAQIKMDVFTSMPGMQIFTANHFKDMPGKSAAIYQANQGVCFESQFYPDSPNQPHFPSPILKANE